MSTECRLPVFCVQNSVFFHETFNSSNSPASHYTFVHPACAPIANVTESNREWKITFRCDLQVLRMIIVKLFDDK